MTQNKQKSLPLWPALIVLILILIFALLNPVCRYLYTKDFVARTDVQLAEMLAGELEEAGITAFHKPILFFGSAQTRTNGSCLDLTSGKYNIHSVFDAGNVLGLDTLSSSQYIVNYLNNLGYNYTAPTEADMTACQAEIVARIPLPQTFPWFDSILETEHAIFVQLSDSFYDIHFKSE